MTTKLRDPNTWRRSISARLILVFAALAALFAVCAAPSRAQEADEKAIGGPEVLLSALGADPSVATYGRGGFVIVWTNLEPGDQGTRGALLAPGAVDPGPPFAVNTDLEAATPAVAADSSGRFVVVWLTSTARSLTIAGQRYGIGGAMQDGFAFPQTIDTAQFSPRVAMEDHGAFDLAWAELDSHVHFAVRAARFSVNGQLQSGTVALPALGVAGNDNAQIAHYPGGFAIGWDELAPCGEVCDTDNHSVNAAVARFDESGRQVGRTYRLSADANTNPGFSLAGLASSRAGALAVFAGPDGYSGQRFAPSGQPVGRLFPIRHGPICDIAKCQIVKAVSMDDNGRFALVWETISDEGSLFDLTAQLYSAGNKLRGVLVPVNLKPSTEAEMPVAALANDGSLEVVWKRVEPPTQSFLLFARRLRLP